MKVNGKQLAEVFGVSPRTIRDWQKEPGFPVEEITARGTANTYETADVIAWHVQRTMRRANPDGDIAVLDKDAELARRLHHDANIRAMEEGEKRDQLIDYRSAERQFGERAQRGYQALARHADEVAQLHLDAASERDAKASYLRTLEGALNEWLDSERSGVEPNAGSSVGAGEAAA